MTLRLLYSSTLYSPEGFYPSEDWLSSRFLTSVIVRELVFPSWHLDSRWYYIIFVQELWGPGSKVVKYSVGWSDRRIRRLSIWLFVGPKFERFFWFPPRSFFLSQLPDKPLMVGRAFRVRREKNPAYLTVSEIFWTMRLTLFQTPV